jgi:hypothetical protein
MAQDAPAQRVLRLSGQPGAADVLRLAGGRVVREHDSFDHALFAAFPRAVSRY